MLRRYLLASSFPFLLAAQQSTDPAQAIREKMEASLALQRMSVQGQVNGAAGNNSGWYTTPWLKPGNWTMPDPRGQPGAQLAPASVSMNCPPIPAVELVPMVELAAKKEGYSPNLLREVVKKESGFYPCAVSPKGAMGLMQLMPGTAEALQVADPFNPTENLNAGARFLGQLLKRYEGDLALALAAYNAGPGTVDAYSGVPPYRETKNYIRDILGALGISQ